jgi:hypothetical protein
MRDGPTFEIVHDHEPNPAIACIECGCEGFRIDDNGLCDGCFEWSCLGGAE